MGPWLRLCGACVRPLPRSCPHAEHGAKTTYQMWPHQLQHVCHIRQEPRLQRHAAKHTHTCVTHTTRQRRTTRARGGGWAQPAAARRRRSAASHATRASHGRQLTPKQWQQGVTTQRTRARRGFKEVITCAREAQRWRTCTPPLMRAARLCHDPRKLLPPFTRHLWHVHVHLAQHRACVGTAA